MGPVRSVCGIGRAVQCLWDASLVLAGMCGVGGTPSLVLGNVQS